ncbi:LRR receptor-like serine/threonine-protein kinase FLS2 [Vigna unguiculata]|uniref:LRR receptor-like serine/threonine-protein kinase FLS2 n=1 Tax=Vigna unguiculata TaxID=3917 RepID=A0A4D6NDH0_VIGUN|nr:LRR receptor-like serine/threonine-protein kinase FLS2 [Vigna unguiculata]
MELVGTLPSIKNLNLCGNSIRGPFMKELSLLPNLEVLDLRMNLIGNGIFLASQDYQSLSRLKKLGTLNLSFNYLNESIMEVVGTFRSIKNLTMAANLIGGPFPMKELAFLPNLEMLDLSGNFFVSHVPTQDGHNVEFYAFKKLKTLNLADNNFDKGIFKSIVAFPSLRSLNLGYNPIKLDLDDKVLSDLSKLEGLFLSNAAINGIFPNQGLCNMKQLQMLDLSFNNLIGTLDACPDNLTSLRYLDFSFNFLSGNVTPFIAQLTSIEHLGIAFNKFEGKFSFNIFANHSKLKKLYITKMKVETENPPWVAPFQLEKLLISIWSNNFSGNIPEHILNRCFSLQALMMDNNKFNGTLLSTIRKLRLVALTASRNNIEGAIAEEWLKPFSPGPIVAAIQLITKNLYLSYISDSSQLLSELDLSCNQLTGEIPPQIGDLHSLHSLNLSHNHLNGMIPENFQKLQNIESLDISYNNLSGQIPLQLQDLHFLAVFNVSYNNLSGRALEKGQFCTFDGSSYKGNPYLTWNTCKSDSLIPPLQPTLLPDVEEENSEIDFNVFYWSFATCYAMALVALVTLLWINPHWRRAWFYFVQECLHKCLRQFLHDLQF